MVWKQDLAKLKQQLKEEGEPSPPPAPKPAAPAAPARPLVDEDALFMAAMGHRPAPAPKAAGPALPPPPSGGGQPTEDVDFRAALGDLQGLKALDRNPVLAAALAPESHPKGQEPPAGPDPAPTPAAAPPIPPPPPTPPSPPPVASPKAPPGPRLIHLAAGMAVDVDGTLDLRGHSVPDARERLKERLQDAAVMGWRTLHVVLGPSEALRQAFLAFLLSPAAKSLAQYAQAPVPMGGNQAFIVYFTGPTA